MERNAEMKEYAFRTSHLVRVVSLVFPIVFLIGIKGATTETHARLQAVNPDGTSAWSGTLPFTIRGV
ncbi:MAG: hypothetical protein N3G20_08390, partial [Verrucomicrobiae bacterium]|nr:hypothetical protein [Verrucomicrobiae bacterium]